VRRADLLVSEAHIDAISRFRASYELDFTLIGFHGQTVLHQPEAGITVQIGDPQRLAQATDCAVVGQFRLADIANGGQGAPLAPLFHIARAQDQSGSLGVLNIGGVANITLLDDAGKICAFDTGPGNALLDDWVSAKTGRAYDGDGALARSGRVDEAALQTLLSHAFFDRAPPKSLDRLAFDPAPVAALSPEDGAATLTAFTAAAVARGLNITGHAPEKLIVCGGGRHNFALMEALQTRTGSVVQNCDELGWAGDALEAEAFAWLAVRHCLGLPTSVPETTGVAGPTVGGRKYNP
jgi:anhydro-N-acetylmuramic acid kinase